MDFLKEAESWEDKISPDGSCTQSSLAESTKVNIKNLANIEYSARELGKYLYGNFDDNDMNNFINKLREGFELAKEIDQYEDKEMERIATYFDPKDL